MRKRALSLVLLGSVALAAAPDTAPVATIDLPPAGPVWAHVSLPAALAGSTLELRDASGAVVPHVVVTRRQAGGVLVGREVARDETPDGRTRVEIALPAMAEAPDGIALPGAAPPVLIEVAAPGGEFTRLVEVDQLDEASGESVLHLPPLVADRVRVTAGSVGGVRLLWDAPRVASSVPLEPVVVGRRVLARAIEILVDLRVERASGLDVALALTGSLGEDPIVLDGPDPDARASAWDPLFFAREHDEPGGPDDLLSAGDRPPRVLGRVRAPDGIAGRWLRVIAPSTEPDSIEIAALSATVGSDRIVFRCHGFSGPVSVRRRAGSSSEPRAEPAFSASWDAGAPAAITDVPFAAPLGYGRAAPPRDAGKGGRPFPSAEIVATVLLVALTIWAFLLRRGG